MQSRFYKRHAKRILDFCGSIFLMILLSPILLAIAALVKLDSKGPLLFRQPRLGKEGVRFQILKFRTMATSARGLRNRLEAEPPLITTVGRWLRRFKLDELPQLWNVLKGEMSIVGPRPNLLHLREAYDDNAEKRLAVKPGMTGLAQIRGNTCLSWPERWFYDAQYVQDVGLFLDLWILIRTPAVMILGPARVAVHPNEPVPSPSDAPFEATTQRAPLNGKLTTNRSSSERAGSK